jgi:hypothetical protein
MKTTIQHNNKRFKSIIKTQTWDTIIAQHRTIQRILINQ